MQSASSLAGSTAQERFLGEKLKNEALDTGFLTCLWQGSIIQGVDDERNKIPTSGLCCGGVAWGHLPLPG